VPLGKAYSLEPDRTRDLDRKEGGLVVVLALHFATCGIIATSRASRWKSRKCCRLRRESQRWEEWKDWSEGEQCKKIIISALTLLGSSVQSVVIQNTNGLNLFCINFISFPFYFSGD